MPDFETQFEGEEGELGEGFGGEGHAGMRWDGVRKWRVWEVGFGC